MNIFQLIERIPEYVVLADVWISPLDPLIGLDVQIAGWGSTYNGSIPNNLQAGTVNILTREICDYKTSILANRMIIGDDRSFCSMSNPYILLRHVSDIFNTLKQLLIH
jgi:hypothetical protein